MEWRRSSAMSNMIVLVGETDTEKQFLIQLEASLRAYGAWTWSLLDVEVGESQIQAINDALERATALILVRGSCGTHKLWSQIQVHGFQARVHLRSHLKIFVVLVAPVILEPSLASQAIILGPGLEVEAASRLCLAAMYASPSTTTFQAFHTPDNPRSPVLHPGAWTLVPDLSQSFTKYAETIESLLDLREYEFARELYWKILYYSGYNEKWGPRIDLSRKLVDSGNRVGDSRNVAMVLAKGLAYVHVEQGRSSLAEPLLRSAFDLFGETEDRRGQAVCWDYLADLAVQDGQFQIAHHHFDKAIKLTVGLERHRLRLKQRLNYVTNIDRDRVWKIASLDELYREFEFIYDYRAPLVNLKRAELLAEHGGIADALRIARDSLVELKDVIGMPRNAAKADKLIESLQTEAGSDAKEANA